MPNEANAIKIRPGSRGRRDTRPSWRSINYASGYDSLGFIPRRGFSPSACSLLEQAEGQQGLTLASLWAGGGLLYLLGVLVSSSPIAGQALSNDLGYAFGPETRIVAVEKAGQKGEHTEGTAAIARLWERLPGEVGGLRGLQEVLGRQLCTTGQNALEAIVAGPGSGLETLLDFDPLTLLAVPVSKAGRWQPTRWSQTNRAQDDPLDPLTVYVSSYGGGVENPYGMPRYGEAFRDLLSDIGEQQGLADVLKAVAFPHIVAYFPLTAMAELGEKKPLLWQGGKDSEGKAIGNAYDWAKDQYNRFNAALPGLLADDSILFPDTGTGKGLDVVAAGNGLTGVLDANARRAQRIAQGLKHPLSLLGMDSGGTKAHFESDFKNHCRLLELFRTQVNAALVWAAQLHLRLLGMNLLVEARCEPIYTQDRLLVARARAQEIRNELELAYSGIQDPEEASKALTESGVFDTVAYQEGRKKWLGQAAAANPTETTTTTDDTSDNGN